MSEATHKRFERYVAIGDSSTEGLNDPDGNGGYRGWSRRLAQRIASEQGGLLYANFGVRGRTTREVLEQQLPPAASLQPDLVTVFTGTNDVLRRRVDIHAIARDMAQIQRTFVESGATVLTFTLPDLTPIMPMARGIAPRIKAMNDAVRTAAQHSGAVLIDFARYPVATDPRLWHEDRIHANSLGHARIAEAMASALKLPGSDDSWSQDLPPLDTPGPGATLVAEIRWARRYLAPWVVAGIRARLTGRKAVARRPGLEVVPPAGR